MMSVADLVRPEIFNVQPYATELLRGDPMLLDANEAPRDDAGDSKGINRYPRREIAELQEQFARHYGMNTAELLLTRGSDEAIDLLIRTFCRPARDAVLTTPPTFAMYGQFAQINGVRLDSVPLDKDTDFCIDADVLYDAMRPEVKLVFLCSPNNPTGSVLTNAAIGRLADLLTERALIIVDEAYAEYGGENALPLIRSKSNVVVMRTLSKAYARAGLRVGVLMAQGEVLSWVRRLLPPYYLSTPVLQEAAKALCPDAQSSMRKRVVAARCEREWLSQQLDALPCVKRVFPSEANFLLIELQPWAVVPLRSALREAEIQVRWFDNSQLRGCLRISFSERADHERLVHVLVGTAP